MCWEHSSVLEGWGADQLAWDYHSGKKNKSTVMDFEMYKSFISSLYNTGNRRITFAGIGEPLLHKNIVEAVAFANEKNMHVRLTTNGSLLTEELMKDLIDAGLRDLSVSINAGAPDEYGLVHSNQKNERFDEIVENLVWLKEYKQRKGLREPTVYLSNVISNINSHRSIEMIKVGADVGAAAVSYRPLRTFAKTQQYDLDEEHLADIMRSFEDVRRIASEHGIATDTDTFNELVALRNANYIPAPCFAGWLFPLVMANGDVIYCCDSREVLGNVGESSFESIWFAPSRAEVNKMALNIHKTQKPVPRSRCLGCERTLQNLKIYKFLWPLWGKPRGIAGKGSLQKKPA